MSGENKRNVRPVKVGGLVLDGKKIYIQSMLNVPSTDIEGSVKQAVELEKAGCEIVRAAIPNMEAVKLIPAIKEKISAFPLPSSLPCLRQSCSTGAGTLFFADRFPLFSGAGNFFELFSNLGERNRRELYYRR